MQQGGAFLVAGTAGFLIAATLTAAFTAIAGLSPFQAWFPATAIAMTCTWAINRIWTFQSRDPRKLRELSRYFAVSLFTAAINYLAYCSALLVLIRAGFDPRGSLTIIAASAFGSLLAAILTFILSREFAFRQADGPIPHTARSAEMIEKASR